MKKQSIKNHNSLPWKAVLLGGIVGYLIAILSNTTSTTTNTTRSAPVDGFKYDRFLKEIHVLEKDVPTLHDAMVEEEKEVNHGGGTGSAEHEEGEEEAEEDKADILDASITVIVLVLVVLTIFFEYVKETIEESVDRAMEPVIEGLFGELTVLGFLSTVTFCITKLGGFSKLGVALFGEEEEEELLEIFEHVHYMLFFIMVFFVINVLVLLYGGKVMSHKWWIYNRACLDVDYMAKFDGILETTGKGTFTLMNYPYYLLGAVFPCRSSKQQMRSELFLFRGLRDEFIAERSLEPPFAPGGTNRVPRDFDFGAYLTICQASSIAHLVHLSYSTWIFLAIVTVFYYSVAMAIHNDPETFAWIWAATGWLIFLLGTVFDFHMVQLLDKMMAPHHVQQSRRGERTALLSNNDGPMLPAWTQVDLDKYLEKDRPIWARCFLRKAPKPTRQDTFYWCESKGPKAYQILFQIQMVFTAAYVSLLCLTLLPYMWIQSEQTSLERVGYLIVSLLPVYLLLNKYQVAAANLTMACSIGNHRRPGAIAEVKRDEKTKMVIWHLVTLQRLKQAAQGGFDLPQEAAVPPSTKHLEDATSIFKALDSSGDGYIVAEEIGKLFEGLGTMPTKETLNAIVRALDKDKNGIITLDEFLNFYQDFIVVELDHHGLHDLAAEMFAQLDVDGSGEITLSEFKRIVDGLDVGFTVDEIGALVNELDASDDGAISEHEFVHLLLAKHRRLFETAPLPNLE